MPLAGVLLFSDGNRTDTGEIDVAGLPPIYPVMPPSSGVATDVGVSQLSVSQTNFESAPAVIRADVRAVGFAGKPIVAVVDDEAGKQRRTPADAGARPTASRWAFDSSFVPNKKGVNFYQVRAFAASDEKKPEPADGSEAPTGEQTLANNSRLVVIDQGAGLTGCST